MKKFKDVENTRKQYHKDPTALSAHRASLLIPEIAGAKAEISFLNHFLLKRGYPHVGLKITAIDGQGRQISSKLISVREPRVYSIRLTGMFEQPVDTYMAEFFAAENLFIPFPAVMVNHHGNSFFNTLHSYNRTLNDVFEDDSVNSSRRAEASIDVRIEKDIDTFVVFHAGPQHCIGSASDELKIELETATQTFSATRRMNTPRLSHQKISLKEMFPEIKEGTTGVLRILQPSQFLFYGRMLVGTEHVSGAWSANHSYYDCSDFGEYWESTKASYRMYPFLQGFKNEIRMYPILSPSQLGVSIDLRGKNGVSRGKVRAGSLVSPGKEFVSIDVGASAQKMGVDPKELTAFTVFAEAEDCKMPARTNHQLIYSAGGLESSINVSLLNPNVFLPPGKTGLTWGQIPVGKNLETKFGLVGNAPTGTESEVEIKIYGQSGLLREMKRALPAGGAVLLDAQYDLEVPGLDSDDPEYLWIMAKCTRPDLSLFAATRHRSSGHCTGEHGF